MMRYAPIAAFALTLAACGQGAGGNEAAPPGAGNGAAPASEKGAASESVAEGLSTSADHGRLADALKAAGLADTLSGAQPYTIFAPTDAAFQKLEGEGNDILAAENKAALVALLTGHIVPGLVTAEDLGRAIDRGKGKAVIATVGGGDLTFTRSGDAVEVAGPDGSRARVGAGRNQSNGAIHPIDTVLMPR
jgi:uncharacterized surface protein with fasciclin (FAS1) repeats